MRFILRQLIKIYQYCLSPLLGPCCRFTPSCSHYAAEALQTYNLFKALLLIAKRLLRCHPWAKSGYDPLIKPE